MGSIAANLSHTAEESDADARPVLTARKSHFTRTVCQTIFLVRHMFEAVLLPDLTDGDAHQRLVMGIQCGDDPVWCDRLRQRNEGSK